MSRQVAGLFVATLSTLCAGCHDPVPLAWKYEAGNNPAAPLVTQNYVALGHSGGVTLLTADGEPICTFDAHGAVPSTPRTDGRLLFFGSTNHVFYAMDSTCKLAWKVATGGPVLAAAFVAHGVAYFTSFDGHVYAVDAATGTTRWMFPTPPSTLPAEEEPALPAGAVKGKGKGKGKLKLKTAKAAKKDKLKHAAALPAAAVPTVAPPSVGAFGASAPTVADGVLYVGNLDHAVYALNVHDGSLKWRFSADGDIIGSPLVSEGNVYFGSADGDIYAVSLITHQVVWKVPTLDAVRSAPHLLDHMLYMGGSDKHLYAIDAAKGDIRWKFEVKGQLTAPPASYKGLLITGGGSGDNTVYALRRTDQTVVWKYQTVGDVEAEPVIFDDRVFVSSTEGMLYVFNIAQAESTAR